MTWTNKIKPAHLILTMTAIMVGALISLFTRDPHWMQGVGIISLVLLVLMFGLYFLCIHFKLPKWVVWAVAIGFFLRLAVGVGLQVGLPVVGQPTEQQQAGYVFQDAYLRDTQAQNLAASDKPILSVFTKGYASDQYGGYLALSMIVYRYITPDMVRPVLMIILSAWVSALAILFFWLFSRTLIGERGCAIAVWLFCLYPHSVVLGATQMREPYLLALISILLWAMLAWFENARHQMLIWAALASLGMILISPGILVPVYLSLGGWWLFSHQRKKLPGWFLAAVIGLAVIVVVAFAYSIASSRQLERYSLMEIIIKWFGLAIEMDMEHSAGASGRIEYLFEGLPTFFQFPFILVYGVLQPVLPAALLDKTLWISNLISSFMAAGWYWLLPLLIYAPFIRQNPLPNGNKKQFYWIIAVCWFWILFASLRAGGDQWDNPRYRTILLPWLAMIFAWGWEYARKLKFYWLEHLWLAEAVFLLFFTQWYASRYHQMFGRLSFPSMALLIAVCWVVIYGYGWYKQRRIKG